MKNQKVKNNKIFYVITLLFLVIFSFLFVVVKSKNSFQASNTSLPNIQFVGEYSIDDVNWEKITDTTSITNTKDVSLKGNFVMYSKNGELIGKIRNNMVLAFYIDHLNVSISSSDGAIFKYSHEIEQLHDSACGSVWEKFIFKGNEDTILTIDIHNPHIYGNGNAINDLIESFVIYDESTFNNDLLKSTLFDSIITLFLIIFSFFVFGVSFVSLILKVKTGIPTFSTGILAVLIGLYIFFSSKSIDIFSSLLITNTNMTLLSLMLFFMFLIFVFTNKILKNKLISNISMIILIITFLSCVILSICKILKLYDSFIIYLIIFLIISLICILGSIRIFIKSKNENRVLIIISYLVINSIYFDSLLILFNAYNRFYLTTITFLMVSLFVLFIIIKIVPKSFIYSQNLRKIEFEKKELLLQLKETQISILLSQIHPHFIFNTLNIIYYLCDIDVKKAKDAIISFSTYLRSNIDNINNNNLVPFSVELESIKAYLSLEKLRYGDNLLIEYDLKNVDFMLPILTIQPLVENAVKHGISKKMEPSTLYLSTNETNDSFEITISDTGVGFDYLKYLKNTDNHVGIINVKKRLSTLCEGDLNIYSVIGEGTKVVVKIPKKAMVKKI